MANVKVVVLAAGKKGPARTEAMGTLRRTIALIGMMGAGKSSVGRRLAARLNVPFHDSDVEIEAAAGCAIASAGVWYGLPIPYSTDSPLTSGVSQAPSDTSNPRSG